MTEEGDEKIFVSQYYGGIEKKEVLEYLENKNIAHNKGNGSNVWAVVKYCSSCPPHKEKPDNLWKVNIYKVFVFLFLLFFALLSLPFVSFRFVSFHSHLFLFFSFPRVANTIAIVVAPMVPGMTIKKSSPPTTPPFLSTPFLPKTSVPISPPPPSPPPLPLLPNEKTPKKIPKKTLNGSLTQPNSFLMNSNIPLLSSPTLLMYESSLPTPSLPTKLELANKNLPHHQGNMIV